MNLETSVTVIQRLAALALLGLVLLTFPLLGLPQGEVAGLPLSWLYVFAIWLLLILLAALAVVQRQADAS